MEEDETLTLAWWNVSSKIAIKRSPFLWGGGFDGGYSRPYYGGGGFGGYGGRGFGGYRYNNGRLLEQGVLVGGAALGGALIGAGLGQAIRG